MLGQPNTFIYEVEGLRQNEQTDNNGYPIRNSGKILMSVPYDRMNAEMQRITRLGGKITNIRSSRGSSPDVSSSAQAFTASASSTASTSSEEASSSDSSEEN